MDDDGPEDDKCTPTHHNDRTHAQRHFSMLRTTATGTVTDAYMDMSWPDLGQIWLGVKFHPNLGSSAEI